MAGTTGLEPATSDVTGASASVLFSANYMLREWVAGDSGRHDPTRNDPLSRMLLTQLLTQCRAGKSDWRQAQHSDVQLGKWLSFEYRGHPRPLRAF